MYLIKKPYHTEKAMALCAKRTYTFLVDKRANKPQIKTEVEKLYNVNVVSVNTAITPGQRLTRYTRAKVMKGRRSDYKKAFVTVQEGHIIDTHDHQIS